MFTGIGPSKTECPMCGNVWQEHTLNEIDGCMAIMHLEFSVALGRGGNTGLTTDEPCPVCHKLPYEHTNDDIRSCLGKWRKRERGATGLELRAEFLQGLTHARLNGSPQGRKRPYAGLLADGGYTPGDTWELYVGKDNRGEYIVYGRGGGRQTEPLLRNMGWPQAGRSSADLNRSPRLRRWQANSHLVHGRVGQNDWVEYLDEGAINGEKMIS